MKEILSRLLVDAKELKQMKTEINGDYSEEDLSEWNKYLAQAEVLINTIADGAIEPSVGVDAMVDAVRIVQEAPHIIALHIVRADAELESVRNTMTGDVVTNGTEFDGIFDDAVEGLLEYHPDLGDKELVRKIKEIVRDIYQGTGNTQSDYERVRDAVESEIEHVERTDKLRP